MANLNKVILIGRLTRDPEHKNFASGGAVCKFGFAVTNRKKNSQTGQWEDEPMFIDVEVYNRGESGKQADLVRDRCRKGSQVMLEAKLHLDTWDDKQTGQRRTKHKLIAENVQLLDPKQDGGGEFGGQQASQRNGRRPSAAATARRPANDDVPPEDYDGGGHDDADIPF